MDINLRNAVIAEARKAREKRKKEKNQRTLYYSEAYDKLKVWEWPAKDRIHMDKHFYFPKIFGEQQFGARMEKSSIAVYPVICSQSNFVHEDWIQISRENIAKIAGIGINSVIKACDDLIIYALRTTIDSEEHVSPLLSAEMITEGKRHFYLYRAGFIRKDMIERWKGGYFIFHTCIINSGVWAELSLRAKALYLTMRSVAEQDFEFYREIEELNGFEWMTEHTEYLRTRRWDLVRNPKTNLSKWAGINYSQTNETIGELQSYRLVEPVDKWHLVYLKPKIR